MVKLSTSVQQKIAIKKYKLYTVVGEVNWHIYFQ